ncbi:MAG: DUF5715 family protein [Candidatus Doudnabacteria bacterium]
MNIQLSRQQIAALKPKPQIWEWLRFSFFCIVQLIEEIKSFFDRAEHLTVGETKNRTQVFMKHFVTDLEEIAKKIKGNPQQQAYLVVGAGLAMLLVLLQTSMFLVLNGFTLNHKYGEHDSPKVAQSQSQPAVPTAIENATQLPQNISPKVKEKALGVTRMQATDEQLRLRERDYIEAQQFSVLKTDPRMEAPKRISQYRSTIEAAAKKHGLDPNLLEAVLTLESHGKTSDQSPTGPRGIAMFAKARGREAGLTINEFTDERLDPTKSIHAAAFALRDSYDRLGNWDFAVVEYHMGSGALQKLIEMYLKPRPDVGSLKQNLQTYGVNYRDIFFRNSPYHNPGTYAMIKKLTIKDWSPRYLYKVKCWQELMNLYRTDRVAFEKLHKQQFYKGKARKAKMWSFFNQMDDERILKISDILDGINKKEFVKLPDGNRFGYTIRTLGKSDPKVSNRQYYYFTKVPTAGMVMYIGSSLQTLRESKDAEPAHFDISSLTRTLEYQKTLRKSNRFATKDESFHFYGLAVDIPFSSLKGKGEKQDLEYILEDLYSAGMVSWVRENGNCYHVVVAPNEEAREFFSDFYHTNVGYTKPENRPSEPSDHSGLLAD